MPPRQRDGDVVGGARLEGGRAAAIRDDHVVTIYAVHDEGPRPYLAMEYIPGVTLESVSAMARRCRLTRPCGSASRSPTVWRPPTTRAWSTGTLPGDVAQVLARVAAETPEPSRAMNPAVPPWLCDLLARLHAPEPGDRIASAREVGMRLGSGLAALQPAAPRRGRRALGVAGVMVLLAAVGLPLPRVPAQDAAPKVTGVPEAVVAKFKLDTGFYKKHVDYHGFSILGSARVSDAALLEARYLIDKLVGERDDILKAMIKAGCRFMVMAPTEMTTDVPEQRHMDKAYWDKRARGLGGKLSSCGEANLLTLKGDRYKQENICRRQAASLPRRRP